MKNGEEKVNKISGKSDNLAKKRGWKKSLAQSKPFLPNTKYLRFYNWGFE